MTRKYLRGKFLPKNPEKYVGDVSNIIFRSSWELKFANWADLNPAVIKWASEEKIIPYISPVDNKPHRYFVDFAVAIKHKDGNIRKYLIEIKPDAQTKPPVPRKRSTNKYLEELKTYSINQAKWRAADEYCKRNQMEFLILSEQHLNVK